MTCGGCQLIVNPFRDESASQRSIDTPSVEAVRRHEGTPLTVTRPYAAAMAKLEAESVTHGPLYFEDPYEEAGSEDDRFAWTGTDYWHILYWRGRFLANAALFPIHAVVTPPWTVMESDGIIEPVWCGHCNPRDARRSSDRHEAADQSEESTEVYERRASLVSSRHW